MFARLTPFGSSTTSTETVGVYYRRRFSSGTSTILSVTLIGKKLHSSRLGHGRKSLMTKKWQTTKPPNERPVEVERGGRIVTATAIWGRDGTHPHWKLEDGT